MFKRFMRSSFVASLVGWLVAAYMVLVKHTTRWEFLHAERAAPIMGNGKGVIALTWHSRFLMLNSAWKKSYQMPHVLISRSRDGEIVARTSHFLGLKTIRGSAKKAGTTKKGKGGAAASRDMIEALERGGCIVITPDGPRGPRQRLGEGPLRLAKLSGVPLLPCTFAIKSRKQFGSWDKFILPLPFGRGQIIWGTPQYVPANITSEKLEALRLDIETEMNDLLAQGDNALGHEPTWPVPRKTST
ncbi:MAG: lysophospholipid acyltransferase family protein [Maricaulaceae bacterium]